MIFKTFLPKFIAGDRRVLFRPLTDYKMQLNDKHIVYTRRKLRLTNIIYWTRTQDDYLLNSDPRTLFIELRSKTIIYWTQIKEYYLLNSESRILFIEIRLTYIIYSTLTHEYYLLKSHSRILFTELRLTNVI